MPLQATSGAASYDAFGGGVAVVPNYIEDVFNIWLYTGNGSTQTITNGIDLAGKGGMVWSKSRSLGFSHYLVDTVRGAANNISTDITAGQSADNYYSGFNSNGYGVNNVGALNSNTATYASWTFRKQPKFFDVVTYTGNGSSSRSVSHALGSVPGCMIVKKTSSSGDWFVYHRLLDNGNEPSASSSYAVLNTTARADSVSNQGNILWGGANPTSTIFTVGTGGYGSTTNGTNDNGATYVAYLFAHNAGGFGLTGTDNVISCGSYTGNGSATGPVVSLGYEPQWLMVKNATGTGNWQIIDNMRGMPVGSTDATLQANLANAETAVEYVSPTATGFQITSTSTEVNTSASTYIYIAIRRDPMKVPTDGAKVFAPIARTGTGANATVTGGQTDDAILVKNRGSAVASLFSSRLTGTGYMDTSSTAAESAANATILQAKPWDVMDGVKLGTTSTTTNASANTFINYLFRRAPNFFDEVCDTGTGSAHTVSHNLQAVPELIIRKGRSGATQWEVYSSALANTEKLVLNNNVAKATDTTAWNSTTPTSSVFTIGTGANVNTSTATYVTYIFATCPGVSKVGSYTGNGSTQTINCGFTGGARFVLIKRTDSTGDWYVWDSARGIVAGNDPYLLLNSTAAEVTSTDYIDTYSAGFEISSTAPAAINASSGSFIFLAIA